ncbi:hypothetical protein B7R21_07375 [Subtercola boreus]|uniref:Excalibur calcium-binding domain-containing protein n=1 Tax=Subtercola boreus TaxID=120213 RepID=A0A3E0VW00_9MICO|nr:DUF1524 domain-containing protein [Subtercola boreus]RFA13880.1 hypothetical protein B7R21_07375 [Subtercola boreus]
MTNTPAGWYSDNQVEGGQRYWDGSAWTTERRATPPTFGTPPPPPPPTTGTSRTARGSALRRRIPLPTWIVGGLVVLALVLFALAGGLGGLLIMLAFVALLTGLYVVITKRRSWAMLPASRPLAAGVVVASLVLFGVGAGVSGPGRPASPASAAVETAEPTAVPSASASPTAQPTPAVTTPASEVDLDPETVSAPPEGSSVVALDTSATTGTALAVLATLEVKGRAPKTGYQRTAQFGEAWLDVDRNGCDTRNDILARDLTGVTMSGPCKVLSGVLDDRYTGTTLQFLRGNTTSTLVQIDHVVALSDAWQKGAQQLSQAQRISLANDPLNLWATDGATNQQKGDGDAATWLPPSKSFRCEYAARQISVKATYGLWVTQAEHDALAGILAACPEQAATSSAFTKAAPAVAADAKPAPTPAEAPVPAQVEPAASAPAPAAPAPEPVAPAPADVTYKNCDAVRAAGAAPIYRGDPGYSSKLDRDGDGIGCEN